MAGAQLRVRVQRSAPRGPAVVLHINLALQGRKCFSNCFGFCLLTVGPPACLPRANERPRRGKSFGRRVGLELQILSMGERGGVVVCGSALVLFIRFNTSQRFMVGISCSICIMGFICPRSWGGAIDGPSFKALNSW